MTADLGQSVVLVVSADEKNTSFGTAFVIFQTDSETLFLTCSHVVRDVEPDKVRLRNPAGGDYSAAILVNNEYYDLAVLQVDKGLGLVPLKLAIDGQVDLRFNSLGSYNLTDSTRTMELISGKLGKSTYPWTEAGNPSARAWWLKLDDESKLQPGYSGSPVYQPDSEVVIGVIALKRSVTEGVAISPESLKYCWPTKSMPAQIQKQLDIPIGIIDEIKTNEKPLREKLDDLTRTQRDKLVKLLAKCEIMETDVGRNRVVRRLPENIFHRVSRAIGVQDDTYEIEDSCFRFPGGIFVLITEVLQLNDGDKSAIKLDEWLSTL